MSGAHDPIREQLVEARRSQLLDAAAVVFAEKGFHRATTKEIARTAGVSEGTIYNYFDSKADLVIGIMARLTELKDLGTELREAVREDARDFLLAVFQHRMELIERNRDMMQAVLPEVLITPALRERFYQQFVQPTAAQLEEYVQARVEVGHMRPVDVPLTVRAVQGMFVGLLILRILGDEGVQAEWDQLPEVLTTLIFDGLSPPEEG
ncbi:MAG: TetR/AcrR family transcriptional regulator [Anaerolineae bacterium]|jgi:TetR/AcrR family fatty acid metabolism transcriptional regulator